MPKSSISPTTRLKPFYPLTPGDAIEEERAEVGLNQDELADILGISLKHLNEIINNKRPLSFEICLLLSKVFKTSPDYWSNIDLKFRLNNSSLSIREEEAELKTRLYKIMPIQELYKKNWLKKTDDFDNLKKQVAGFWGLRKFNIEEIEKKTSLEIKTRISESNYEKLNSQSLKVWHQHACTLASEIKTYKYNENKLVDLKDEIDEYTYSKDSLEDFIIRLTECGVKFIILPHLQNTYLDGAAFICEKNPVIGYTSRFNRLDNFWWTISHEIGHILLGHLSNNRTIILDNGIDNNSSIEKEEKEADKFAGEILKKDKILDHFNSIGTYVTEERLVSFSKENKLHPSITVGILAFAGMVSYVNKSRFNEPVLEDLQSITVN
jgi:HTH-type transcriptional regulator/antitoxin HigA